MSEAELRTPDEEDGYARNRKKAFVKFLNRLGLGPADLVLSAVHEKWVFTLPDRIKALPLNFQPLGEELEGIQVEIHDREVHFYMKAETLFMLMGIIAQVGTAEAGPLAATEPEVAVAIEVNPTEQKEDAD